MRLEEYLAESGTSKTDFARQIGVQRFTVARYIDQGRVPEPSVMCKIIEVTDGKVTANDFFGLAA